MRLILIKKIHESKDSSPIGIVLFFNADIPIPNGYEIHKGPLNDKLQSLVNNKLQSLGDIIPEQDLRQHEN